MFKFFASKYIEKIEELETKIARMQVEIDLLKTELVVAPLRKTLEKIEAERSINSSTKDETCCDAGCSMTPNCPKSGAVF